MATKARFAHIIVQPIIRMCLLFLFLLGDGMGVQAVSYDAPYRPVRRVSHTPARAQRRPMSTTTPYHTKHISLKRHTTPWASSPYSSQIYSAHYAGSQVLGNGNSNSSGKQKSPRRRQSTDDDWTAPGAWEDPWGSGGSLPDDDWTSPSNWGDPLYDKEVLDDWIAPPGWVDPFVTEDYVDDWGAPGGWDDPFTSPVPVGDEWILLLFVGLYGLKKKDKK